MKTSFWRRWCNSLRSARPTGRVRAPDARRRPLGLEALEDRVTPSLTPQMVLDINTTTLASNPSGMVAIGSTAYFAADDGVHGRELWKSDGTAAGTVARQGHQPRQSAGSTPVSLTNVNGTLFFTANDGDARARAVEERRHRRRHRPGQGHQPRQPPAPTPAT